LIRGAYPLIAIYRIDAHAASQQQMTMKMEFNIINLRETIMGNVYNITSKGKNSIFICNREESILYYLPFIMESKRGGIIRYG